MLKSLVRAGNTKKPSVSNAGKIVTHVTNAKAVRVSGKQSQRMNKSIILEDGTIYDSLTSFADSLGVTLSVVSKHISRGGTPDSLKTRLEAKFAKRKAVALEAKRKETLTAEIVAMGALPAEGYHEDYLIIPDGRVYNQKTCKFLKPVYKRTHVTYDSGYFYLSVKNADGKFVKHALHILVCTAHHGPKPDGLRMTVDHIDRDVYNNHATNLKWCEQAENNDNRGGKFEKSLQ